MQHKGDREGGKRGMQRGESPVGSHFLKTSVDQGLCCKSIERKGKERRGGERIEGE